MKIDRTEIFDEDKIKTIFNNVFENIIKRHKTNNNNNDIVIDHIKNTITLDTELKIIKNYTFKNIIIDNFENSREHFTINQYISGYDGRDTYYTI